MKVVNIALLAVVGLAYLIAFGQMNGIVAIAFFAPFCITPYAINAWLAWRLRFGLSQLTLAMATLLYTVWFVYLYLSATVWHVDAQSGIVFLFVGIYALPVLLPIWGLALWLEMVKRRVDKQKTPHKAGL